MAARGALKQIYQSTGKTKEEMILVLLPSLKAAATIARKLDVANNTVRVWLETHGYEYDPECKQWTRLMDQTAQNSAVNAA